MPNFGGRTKLTAMRVTRWLEPKPDAFDGQTVENGGEGGFSFYRRTSGHNKCLDGAVVMFLTKAVRSNGDADEGSL
jgi:hypothetical protein